MMISLTQAQDAIAAGNQHWLDVVAGKVIPEIPAKYDNEKFRHWFAKGAVEAMNNEV